MGDGATISELPKRKRFWELDFIRGLAVILMVFDHIMYSIGYIFKDLGESMGKDIWTSIGEWIASDTGYWNWPLRTYVRLLTLFGLFFICGVSCSLSRSNLKRGIMCFLVGCGITFFTILVDKIIYIGCSIYFGVLHMLGLSIILYGLIDLLTVYIAKFVFWAIEFIRKKRARGGEFARVSQKTKDTTSTALGFVAPTIGLIFFILYFCLWGSFQDGKIVGNVVIEDPSMSVFASLFVYVKNSSVNGIYYSVGGADYWPLLPWGMIVLMGGFVGRAVYKTKAKNYLERFDGKWNKPICFVGRNAIAVYVAHQVVIFILLYIITLLA